MQRILPRASAKHKGRFDWVDQFLLATAEVPRYLGLMRIVFAADELALIETDEAGATRLPVAVIKSARRKLTVLRAATDDRSLRNWKSLRDEKLKGNREDQRSIRINDQYRMVFRLNDETDPPTITILSIEDYH
jgi:proteic killer suppression protein